MAVLSQIPEPEIGPVVQVESLHREFRRSRSTVKALRGVDLSVAPGERVAIMGPSGCGKTTLLSLVGGLDRPTSGRVMLAGRDLSGCSRSELARIRRLDVGYVPQGASLLPMLTVAENVELPMLLGGEEAAVRARRVSELLDRVELDHKTWALPEELSGGQRQRAALARALAAHPSIILADEPTGSLDSATADAVLALLMDEAKRESAAILMVTHEETEALYADRIVRMRDGRILQQDEVQ